MQLRCRQGVEPEDYSGLEATLIVSRHPCRKAIKKPGEIPTFRKFRHGRPAPLSSAKRISQLYDERARVSDCSLAKNPQNLADFLAPGT